MRRRVRTLPATTANITKAVIGFINDQPGGFAFPCKTVGVYDPEKKVFRKLAKDEKGKADVMAVLNGRAFAVEVKNSATGDKLRKDQIDFKKKFEAAGGVYMTCEKFSLWKLAFVTLYVQ